MLVLRRVVRRGLYRVWATQRTWVFSSPESRSCCGTRQRGKVPALRRRGGRRGTKEREPRGTSPLSHGLDKIYDNDPSLRGATLIHFTLILLDSQSLCGHPWGSLPYVSVNSQPWRFACFTNNSLGLPHAPSLSVCLFLWVCVVCGARGSEAQRAEAAARHQGRSRPGGEIIWVIYQGFICIFPWYRGSIWG